jgi:alanyl-tRNA synthetase
VILDRTAFYPEGGGQVADRGELNDQPVLDVQKHGGQIRHYLRQSLAEGSVVKGTIDWTRRFEHMQQHTGQHIVSASLITAAGYPTISAHLGDRYTAVEIDTDDIQEQQIRAAETLANQRVTENLPVQIHWIGPAEVQRYNLRKPPPEVDKLRIVEIEGVDAAACAGTHVATTGEVGLIKYDGLEKIRGRLRLHWLIGRRAYEDTRDKDRLIAALNRELTCGTEDILASVRDLKNKLRERELRLSQLNKTVAEQRAQSLLEQASSRAGIRLVRESFAEEESSYVQTIYQKLLDYNKTVACILNRRKADIQWWIGCSQDLELSWKRILPGLFPLIDGKGGGKDRSWQGIGTKPEGEERFLEDLEKAIWEWLPGSADG